MGVVGVAATEATRTEVRRILENCILTWSERLKVTIYKEVKKVVAVAVSVLGREAAVG